jgi:hypothetical protein
LSRAVRTLPAFLHESRLTLARLDAAGREWTPTVQAWSRSPPTCASW